MMISVPLLTPYLSSLWLGVTTPAYARVGLRRGPRDPEDLMVDGTPS